MSCTLLYLPDGFTLLLFVLFINLAASVIIAVFIGSKKIIGLWGSLLICLVTSAIIGLIITLFFKTKTQKQIENTLDNMFSGLPLKQAEIQHLKALRQSGIISRREYEEEIDRLLNS